MVPKAMLLPSASFNRMYHALIVPCAQKEASEGCGQVDRLACIAQSHSPTLTLHRTAKEPLGQRGATLYGMNGDVRGGAS